MLEKLSQYRHLFLRVPPAAEAGPLRRLGHALRDTRRAAGLSRQQLAQTLSVDLALIVAVENGYGDPSLSRRLLRRARRACAG